MPSSIYDPRVCLAAGGAALVQYAAIVTWVGLFEPTAWTVSQVSRHSS